MSAIPERVPDASRLLPSGTVTFVFTDIEGSTVRWERDPAAMQDAVRRHDAIVRSAIEAHGGHVFKTIGDAFCAAFSRPADAVHALLAAQLALDAEDFAAVEGLRVRAAIHTGTADERDADFFGPTVNRVARLLAVGNGGQVLLSGVAAELARNALPRDSSLRDLGDHRLKDLARPERVFQLVAPGLPEAFPPLRSLDALPNNLPATVTSFFGRETEIAEITALLRVHRIVTLTGSGGIGKTRTSLHVAASLLEAYRDGVWFVELAPISDGGLVPSIVAAALGLSLSAQGDPAANLASALETKAALLVFDNCEHLVDAVARVVGVVARGCPNVGVLASSRQALGIAGEATYLMPSLGVPAATAGGALEAADVSRYPALALFVDRARAVNRSFELSDANVLAVADICRRLDGIPLAIELAAARVKILNPRQLRDRLDERFRVLTGGSRDVLPRQQTLRALIDWSHDLLDERERAVFRRLSIFVDGFALEGALLGGDDDASELDVLDLLTSLVDKSLVLSEPDGETQRYRFLESTNAYAREKLAEAGETQEMALRHVRYMRDLFVAAGAVFEQTGRSGYLSGILASELGNVRASLDASIGGVDPAAGAEMLVVIDHCWNDVGFEREGWSRNEAFLEKLGDADPLLFARLSVVRARIASSFGQGSIAIETSTLAVARARVAADPMVLADALIVYAWNVAAAGRFDEADAALAEAEAATAPTLRLRLAMLNTRAFVGYHSGDLANAALLFDRLRGEHRALGNRTRERMVTLALAEVEYGRGDTLRAIALVRDVLLGVEKHRQSVFRTSLLSNLAGYLMAAGDSRGARDAARDAIEELGSREPESFLVTNAMQHLALAFALEGDTARAAQLIGYVDAANERHGYRLERNESASRERLGKLLAERLDGAELEGLVSLGNATPGEAAVALAIRGE